MRRPHSRRENSPLERGRRWHERYTSHANYAGCMQRVYSSIYVEELSQKKQSWWISTTSCGDFQPKKILIQNSSRPLQHIGSQGGEVSSTEIKCL